MKIHTPTLMNTYARKNVSFVRGDGVWLYTKDNEKYLDALSGIAVCGLGHAHPKIASAIAEQANSLLHTSNIYRISTQENLGKKLCELSGLDTAFFCNSGAEANEAAIKLSRIYGNQKKIKQPSIIVMENSFHGRTMATLTATGNRKAHDGFEPLVHGFIRVPFDDVAAVNEIISNNDNVVAILVEPIQGEGGIIVPETNYLTELRLLCDQHNLLLMLDEVQTGNARTGKWFCFQHENILPDVVAIAKGLANGVPIGACLAKKEVADLLAPGSHGSTFGGNPLACRAGLETLEIIENENLLEHANKMGQYLLEQLHTQLENCSIVKEVRGKGLMIGIELNTSCTELVDSCLVNKLLINVTSNTVIRLLPPLIIQQTEVDILIKTLVNCIQELAATA